MLEIISTYFSPPLLGLPFVAEDEGASPFCAGSALATFLTGDPAVAAISASMVADSDIATILSARNSLKTFSFKFGGSSETSFFREIN